VAVVLTLAQTKQIRVNIHKKKKKKHSTNSTEHSKCKYKYYKTPPPTHPPTHYKTKQTQYKIYPNKVVTIQSRAVSVSSP
jgi:hypothetical protein